jgi:DNA-binding LacI/PurR family transcriptional regulator
MPTTMAEVARRAGVSKSTVSLVLNDRPTVSPELRQAVLQAASELGYRLPAHRPQRRATGNRSIVAIHYERYRSEPQITSLLIDYVSGIQSFVRDKDINLTLIADYCEDDQQLGVRLVQDGHLAVDGAILMGWSARRDGRLLRMFVDQKVPLVVLSRNWPDLPISTVGQDHHQQACIALDHLIQLGHKKIAFLATEDDQRHEWYEWRLEYYEQSMRQHCQQVDPELVVIGRNGFQAVQSLLSRRPDVTAVFAITDPNAIAAMRGLREMGLLVPQDVSVIGLDGITLQTDDVPALTTVAWPHFEAGRQAAELLLRQIENDQIYYQKLVLQSRLVVQASCAPPRSTVKVGAVSDEPTSAVA